MRAFDRRGQFLENLAARKLARPFARDYHQVRSRLKRRSQVYPEAFAHSALDAIARHRVADFPRYGHAKADSRRFRPVDIDNEVPGLETYAGALRAEVLSSAMQPVGGGETESLRQPGCFGGIETASRWRPLFRLRFSTLRPPGVAIRARNPCVRLRRRLWG